MKITVYAITKNEEKFVDRWVDSMREADSIVVLDTGSTDNTVDRLKNRGVKVKTKPFSSWKTIDEYKALEEAGRNPWRFDVSRNDSIDFALEVAPYSDLLVCTDLDEILLPGWREKLEKAYIDAKIQGLNATTFTYEYVWNFNPDGTDGCKFTYEKIHTPESNARWTHPVHEILSYSLPKVSVNVPGMRLEHHPDATKSRSQYLHLLELSVKEAPMDDRNFHYYGRELMFNRRWEDSIKTLKQHLLLPTARWDEERAASMRFIARCYGELGDVDSKELWLRKACDEYPYCREARYELIEAIHSRIVSTSEKDRNWLELVHACERLLDIKERRQSYLTLCEAWGYRPWDLYSIALWYSGRKQDAIKANEVAMKMSPNDVRLKENDSIMRELTK